MTAELRAALARALRDAPEARLRAVMATIDRHPARAEVEDLVEPVRPRLAGLAIPRPLTPHRAVVVPFEGLLAPIGAAKDALRLPREVLAPLFALVRARIDPALWEQAGRLAEGRRADDTVAVLAVGRALWPAAIEALAALQEDPRGVGRTLAAAGHDPHPLGAALRRILPMLRHAEAITQAMLPRHGVALDPTLPTAPHRPLLLGSVQRDPPLFRLIAAAMLFRCEFPDSIARLLRDIALRLDLPGVLAVAAEVAEALKADLAAPAAGATAERRSRTAMRLVMIVSALEGIPRFDALAAETGHLLGAQFAAVVRETVLDPLAACAARGEVGPDAAAALEAAALAAKRIEAAARIAGAAPALTEALAAARQPIAALMRRAAATGGVGRAELARVAEILLGPDEAMALLDQTS